MALGPLAHNVLPDAYVIRCQPSYNNVMSMQVKNSIDSAPDAAPDAALPPRPAAADAADAALQRPGTKIVN